MNHSWPEETGLVFPGPGGFRSTTVSSSIVCEVFTGNSGSFYLITLWQIACWSCCGESSIDPVQAADMIGESVIADHCWPMQASFHELKLSDSYASCGSSDGSPDDCIFAQASVRTRRVEVGGSGTLSVRNNLQTRIRVCKNE